MNFFDKFKISPPKENDKTEKKTDQQVTNSLLEEAKQSMSSAPSSVARTTISHEDIEKLLSNNLSAESEVTEPEPEIISGGSGINQEDIDKILGVQTLGESFALSSSEIDNLLSGGVASETSETPDTQGEPEASFSEKLSQKMQNIYEKAKDISSRDVKTFFTKERESQIVETGGKIGYDTLGTIAGTKAITDWALYGLHKAGVKSSIKGDVHKYFAENDMERALVGITNSVVALRRRKEEIKKLDKDKRKEVMGDVKPELKKAIQEYRAKVDNLNVSEEKKKSLRLDLSSIIRDHKEQELTIAKGESEKFDQAMRHYTGNKVSGLKLGKDALNSALSLSGFYALRGASYLGFSASEKIKETWDKKSREDFLAKREEIKKTKKTEDMPDWRSNYWKFSGDKMKAVAKEVTVGSAKETYNELVYGRKEGKSVEAKERKESFMVEKSANIEMLKQHLEEEGKGLFGKAWRVNWERVKNLNPETIKENLMRAQAIGKIARVVGVSLVGIQAYESDGSIFKGAYDKLLDSIEKEGIVKTAGDNMYGNVARLADAYDKTAEKIHEAKIFDLKTWQDRCHDIADKFHHIDSQTGQTELEKEFNERAEERIPIIRPGGTAQGVEFEENSFKTLQEKIDGTENPEEKLRYIKEARLFDVEDKSVQNFIVSEGEGASEGSGIGLSGASHEISGAEKTPEKHFQIADKFEAEKNNNIWSMGERYLRGNQKFIDLEGKHGVEKALETYNIDRIKDEIVAHPEKYGLKNALERILGDKYEKLDPADRELFLSKLNKMGKLEPIFRKLTVQDLNSINWQDAFDKEFLPPASKGITETLTDQQIKGVLASNDNEYEKRFGHEHHGRGKGHAKPLSGIDAPPHATAVEVPNDLATHEKVPVETGPIDDTKIIIDGNLVIDKDSQFADEWKIWKNRSADDFLHRRYGEALTTQKVFEEPGKMDYEKDIVHVRPDAQEMSNREELRGRLENARHIIGDPKKGETVGDFMARYNNENAGVNKALYDGLANSAALNGNVDVKAEVWSIVDKMPGELKHGLSANFATNKEVALGYVKLFFGDRGGVSEGIKKFFDYQGQIDPESIKIKPDGSILYENAFGKNNYDLQISKDKVGVDGPLFRNMEKTGLSLESIKNAKIFIIEGPVSKTLAEATMDMGKEGMVVSGEGAEVIKPEVKIGADSEKVVPVVGKNVDNGMEKSAGKGVMDDSDMKKLQELEKKAEKLEKNSSTIKPEKELFHN